MRLAPSKKSAWRQSIRTLTHEAWIFQQLAEREFEIVHDFTGALTHDSS
jgi:hypothetical protein